MKRLDNKEHFYEVAKVIERHIQDSTAYYNTCILTGHFAQRFEEVYHEVQNNPILNPKNYQDLGLQIVKENIKERIQVLHGQALQEEIRSNEESHRYKTAIEKISELTLVLKLLERYTQPAYKGTEKEYRRLMKTLYPKNKKS